MIPAPIRGLFALLDAAPIDYLVLRGYLPLGELGNPLDIDVYIARRDRGRATAALARAGWLERRYQTCRFPHRFDDSFDVPGRVGTMRDVVYGLHYGDRCYALAHPERRCSAHPRRSGGGGIATASVPPLRRRLQHGDLWAGNVLRYRDSWWLIDFAEFGHAQVPLYDVFLFVFRTWMMLGLGSDATDWREACREMVAAAAGRLGLSPQEVAATMIYYLIHLSSYRLRHGACYMDRAPFLRALLGAAESLRAACPLERLAFPWEARRQ